jgi:3-hydroxyisobutyrate dehydrogenase
MALAAKTGVDLDLLIKAVASGSGGSMQFGIRAPWMAHRQFLPAQGTTFGLSHYFELIGDFADRVGVATPLFNRAIEVHQRVIDEGFGEYDHAVLIDVIGNMKREKSPAAMLPHAKDSK